MHKNRNARSEAKRRLAEELGVSVSLVNKRKLVVNDLISVETREKQAEKAQKHREMCRKLAKQAIKREIDHHEAALVLGITNRQFARWVRKLRSEATPSAGAHHV
jgi:hypothetical protein